jgi:SAM-dependent methyltransferase
VLLIDGQESMMTWTSGYFTELNYTFGYYREMSPLGLRLACLCNGVDVQVPDAPTYLELGFGHGVSINMHAAGSAGRFFGTDFNPSQVFSANQQADASRADIKLFDQSFEEFARREDIPDFDVIALHGVWSWVSEGARAAILDIIRRKLRPGGIAYVSYNCLPGWAPVVPIRQLMSLYRDSGGGRMAKVEDMIENGMAVVEEVAKAGSLFFQANPFAAHHLKEMARQSKNYIAHEYLNADWHLAHFADTVDRLNEAKLTYVGSARLLDGIDMFNLTPEGVTLISQVGDRIMRETLRDYLVNRQFRTDIFVKGARALSRAEHQAAWSAQRFVLSTPAIDIPKRLRCPRGEVELPKEKYDLVIEAMLANGQGPKTIPDLLANPDLHALTFQDVVQILTVLAGAGFVAPATEPSAAVKRQCWRLNNHVLSRAKLNPELLYLVSPLTGGGISVPHLAQLFILAFQAGAQTEEELVLTVGQFLDQSSDGLLRNGVRMDAEETSNLVRASAARFLRHDWPLLMALQVLDEDCRD